MVKRFFIFFLLLLLFAATNVSAAPVFIQSKSNSNYVNNSISVTLDSSVTSGNLISGFVYWANNTGTITSVTGCGGTYTLVNNPTTGSGQRAAGFYATNIAGGSCTVTVNFSGVSFIFASLIVHEVSGIMTSSPLDGSLISYQSGPGTGTGAVSSGSITTTNNGDYIFGATTDIGYGSIVSSGTGFTGRASGSSGLRSEDMIQSSQGGISATFTSNIAYAEYLTLIMAFKSSSVSPTPSPNPTPTPTPTPTPVPTVSISASPSTITSGSSSTLTWSSTDSTSCTASNGWSGTKSTSGTQAVNPTVTTTYTLSCTGAGGSSNQSTTITVNSVTPTPTPTPPTPSPTPPPGGSSPIDSSRTIDWTQAGVVGGIPNRTTICSTLNPGATAAQINTAIANCPAGQVVFLNAGTYTVGSPGIIFNDKSNVTLRGAGPDATFLNFTGSGASCGGVGGNICVINGSPVYSDAPGNTANWTAGYAKGTNIITLSSTANLQPGTLIYLDQLDDGTTDTGNVWNCSVSGAGSAKCSQAGDIHHPGRTSRGQMQTVTVVSVSGNNVTISPSIYMPNWRSSQSPGAWWSPDTPVTGVGIESLSINGTSSSNDHNIGFYIVSNSWVKNVRSINPGKKHIRVYLDEHITIRDSYMFDTQTTTNDAYGVSIYAGGCDTLIENNIFQSIPNPVQHETGCGTVAAYNYTINNDFGGPSNDWAQPSFSNHEIGSNFFLFEGNDGFSMSLENYFGGANFVTAFRNRFYGWQTGKINQTVPIFVYPLNRYVNVVGNVLGTVGYHTNYEMNSVNFTDPNVCNHSIYSFGLGDNCDNGQTIGRNDPLVATTMFRWGNYDTVTNSTKWLNSEVPSNIGLYGNGIPSSQSLPYSLYLSSRPSFWPSSVPWPAIGPDVTGGSEANVGGHNALIPARRCFETIMGGTFNDTTARTFNANSCYSNGSVTPTPSPNPSPTPIAGDLNLDHVVNSLDWSIMNSQWFTSNSQSDLRVDGQVNSLDFAILSSNWGRTW